MSLFCVSCSMHAKCFSCICINCSPPCSSVHGDSPDKNTGVWLPCPAPGNLPDPGIKPASLTSPALAGQFFITRATGEALLNTGVGKYLSHSPAWSPLLGHTELTNTTGAASSPPNLSQPTSLRLPYVPHRPQLHRDSPQKFLIALLNQRM